MPLCSVIMVSGNTGPMLFASVSSVLRQQQLAELVVVDTGNPLEVLTRLQQMALTEPRLKIITGQGSAGTSGYAKACNAGVNRATGDFLLLLAPDGLLPPKALADTMQLLNATPGAMLAGCLLMNADGSGKDAGQRQAMTPFKALAKVLGFPHRHETPPAPPYEVASISGAFMCLRRSDYLRLSGLDEGFFSYGADLDLCARMRKAQGKIIVAPSVKVIRMPRRGVALPAGRQTAQDFARYASKHFSGGFMRPFLLLARLAIMIKYAVDNVKAALWRPRPPILLHSVAARRAMILASGLAELTPSHDLYGRTVLVTGATGQVGLCVLRRMIAAGASVLALSRDEPMAFQHEQLRWIKGDLTDARLDLEGYLIDIVVHCASLWYLPPIMDLLIGAEVKRIIAFGSTSIFARALSKNHYDKELVSKLTKAEADIAARCDANGIAWTIFRPTLIYGLGLDANITTLAKFIRRFGFFPVYPPAFGRRQPVHADDLAMGVLQAVYVQSACGKAYNLSGGDILTYRQMLERLFALCRRKTRIIESTMLPFVLDMLSWMLRKKHINGEMARRMNDDLIFFHDEAAKDFGFSPRPFLSGGIRDLEGY